MTESFEFRIWEKYASRLFGPTEGKHLGPLTRKVVLSSGDPRFNRIGELNESIKNVENSLFFSSWQVRRSYTSAEIEAARLFLIVNVRTFEPAGEERGTVYDESSACRVCGAGAIQKSSLFLDWTRIPKGVDIAKTIAGEIIVSRKFVESCKKNDIRGADFFPVRQNSASSAESPDWLQVKLRNCNIQLVPPTRIGVDPFDEDKSGKFRCPCGDLIGLARLSEVWIKRSSYKDGDLLASSHFIGARRGLLRPERLIFGSPNLERMVKCHKLKGFKFEIAHPA